ncbi:macrophage immunometabolism regulator [Grus japonensis]|uniref:ribonuclease H n=1 Tax=Grus japonensis TaxID=30415 RepID=A0ABC9YDY9_GRUJA
MVSMTSHVRKSNGEWRLTVDYRGLNDITPPMTAAMPDMLELQYELESKAAKWYATMDIANAFFSIPLAAECRPQFAFTWRGVQYTWNRLPQGWKHSPTICHGLIQTALEKGEAPEHLQCIDDIIVWGNTAEVVSEKGKEIVQIVLIYFAIKQRSPSRPGILEVITDWPEGKDFGMLPEEEVTRAEEAPLYNKLTEDEKPYALFTDGSCRIVGKHRRWKAAVWSPTRRVAEAAEGEGESSQFAEVKAIQLALDIAEREKWPMLYLYTD